MRISYGRPSSFSFSKSNAPPQLSGHRIVCTEDSLYSFGGFSETRSHPLVIELWQFHLLRETWRKVPMKGDIPQCVASSAVALVRGTTIILFGGTGIPFGTIMNRDVFACNVNSLDGDGCVTWRKLAVWGDIPEPGYGQAVTADDDYFYCVGGSDGFSYSIEVHRLNLRTLQWEQLASKDASDRPVERYRAEIVIYNNKIIVFGGGTPDTACTFETLPEFDLVTRKWSESPRTNPAECPAARKSHSLVQSSNRDWVVIAGGIGGSDDIFRDIWKYHLPSQKWFELRCTLPQKIYFHSAASTSFDRMYILGGVLDPLFQRSQRRTNRLTVIDIQPSPLQDMCLRRIVSEEPYLLRADTRVLEEHGIPHVFFGKFVT